MLFVSGIAFALLRPSSIYVLSLTMYIYVALRDSLAPLAFSWCALLLDTSI